MHSVRTVRSFETNGTNRKTDVRVKRYAASKSPLLQALEERQSPLDVRIIPSGLERIRPRSLVVLRRIIVEGYEMLHIEYIGGADVAREFEAVGVGVDLLDELYGPDLLGCQFVVVTSGEAFLGEDGPHKIPTSNSTSRRR